MSWESEELKNLEINVLMDNIGMTRSWYLGECRRKEGSGSCGTSQGPGSVPLVARSTDVQITATIQLISNCCQTKQTCHILLSNTNESPQTGQPLFSTTTNLSQWKGFMFHYTSCTSRSINSGCHHFRHMIRSTDTDLLKDESETN